jgi:3-hydroxy-9,10-secoandrosta-1,3,5(10)-triene-9,17-dione monooxygenase
MNRFIVPSRYMLLCAFAASLGQNGRDCKRELEGEGCPALLCARDAFLDTHDPVFSNDRIVPPARGKADMPDTANDRERATKQQIMDRVSALLPGFRQRAEAAEESRRLPAESARELLSAGLARILMPLQFGGYGLGFDTWFDVVRAISKVDASHGWCASLIIHHPHCIAQFPEEAQKAVWAEGPDVAIAASFVPVAQITPVEGGYRVSGQSPFASGVGHSTWVFVGGMTEIDGKPEWTFFLVPAADYKIADTWFTAGMRGTGSNTIVTQNAFVPRGRTLPLSKIIEGKGPGGALHEGRIYRTPFISYAPLTFALPMLGAAQGAYEYFQEWTKRRKGPGGVSVAERTSIQVQMARAAADLDAAELLLRRAADVAEAPTPPSLALRARGMRDYARVSELTVAAIDALIAMSGTAGFGQSHPIQRAWRDIRFSAMHISLNAENAYSHFGRLELGLPQDPNLPYY